MRPSLLLSLFVGTVVLSCAIVVAQENSQRSDAPSTPAPPSPNATQSDSSQIDRFIDDFDENGDGELEKSELPPRMRAQFASLDRDGNKQISRRELSQHGRTARQRGPVAPLEFVYIWVTDADQGHLSLHELQRAYDTLQKIDKDGNGELARRSCKPAARPTWPSGQKWLPPAWMKTTTTRSARMRLRTRSSSAVSTKSTPTATARSIPASSSNAQCSQGDEGAAPEDRQAHFATR